VGTSSFQGKAKNLKWLFYACQIIFKSCKVLHRGRSLPKDEALPWGWLSPTLWLQTESFERQIDLQHFSLPEWITRYKGMGKTDAVQREVPDIFMSYFEQKS